MAGSNSEHKVDSQHAVQPVSSSSSRSELVNNFITYYSSGSSASFSPHDLLSTPPQSSTPTSTSSSSTAASVMNMRAAKKLPPAQSSGQSTDSENTGNGSSESSMGDSAAAAARVLAAWQDRPAPPSDAGESVSAGISPTALANSSALWVAARAARVQSSTSTPRQGASSFDPHTREGSAPVAGSLEVSSRRPDMGFLALLNSAAAYVAESSIPTQPGDHSYLSHGDMLSDGTLTLSGINNGFGQGDGAEQGDYSAHYSTSLSSAAYQDLAQALQHIAATSSGSGDGIMSTAAAMEPHGSYVPHDYVSEAHLDTRSAIRPDQMMAGGESLGMKAEYTIPRQSSASKRKRKEPTSESTPTKRKASHTEYPPGGGAAAALPHSAEARRAARKWSEEETDNLLQGCTKYGVGAWKKILDDASFTFNNRTSVDLKDRFRTIRAQECAHSPHSKLGAKKTSGKEPDVVWPLPPNSQRLQGLQRVQRKPTRNYTGDEDRRLLIGVLRHANHWTKIAADPDLKLGDRPGQSLRDRLRNAFPEVFELFGYVIPKKERADREPCGTSSSHQESDRASAAAAGAQRRKAPTASKRMDGLIPENIKDKIMAVLGDMNASLDPHPIPDDVDSCYDADASAMDVDSPGDSHEKGGAAAAARAGKTGRGPRRRSTTVSGEVAPLPAELLAAASASRDAGGSNKRGANKRSRSRSKTMGLSSAAAPLSSSGGSLISFKLEPTAAFPMSNDGGIHSAPTDNAGGCGALGDLSAFSSDCDQRRAGTVSAGAFGNRNFLLESFAPSVFTRPLGTMTPTDQLDALALEGRFGSSGYSTPTHSAKRRHSVQVDLNDAMVAAVAAGMDRSGFHYFHHHPGVGGLDPHHHHSAGSGMSSDSIRRMTVGGPIDADAFLFPRIPDDDATVAAAAAAAVAGISAQLSAASQTVSTTPASDTMHTASTVTAAASSSDLYKFPPADTLATAPPPRGQLRSAQRLLRANGVADDNSIGLSTTSSGESRADLEALAQFSQWFPQFAPASLGWGESIDPNMLDAGLDSAMAAAVAANGSGSTDAGMTHARRRSQYDWYGLTPSLAAALEAASTGAAVVGSDDAAMSTLGSFGLAQAPPLNASFRRPSMPIFPTFGDMLAMPPTTSEQQPLYGVAPNHHEAAAAAADVPGRRRTMHVPPLLLEGVATAEFAAPLSISPAPRRPIAAQNAAAATAAMTRGRRSRTISSNCNAPLARLGVAGAIPSAARPPLPPVCEARHARSLSGTQLTHEVSFDAATLGDYAASFKPSLWPFGDDVSDCVAMHDETRSLVDMRARDAPGVDLYRPASSTPTGHRYPPPAASARNHSPLMSPPSATAPSPVAPRSAASTPGRREAVGL